MTRYQDVLQVLKDPRFSGDQRKGGNAGLKWLDQPWVLHAMIAVDDPDHRRLRDLVHQAFTPRMIARVAHRVEALSQELLDHAAKQSEVDLISAFALPLPLTIIAEMIGVSKEDRLRFHHRVAPLVDVSEQPWTFPVHAARLFQLDHFFESWSNGDARSLRMTS